MRRLFRYREQPNFPPRFNVAPTQPIPVVRLENGVRHFALMRWGLLPSWVKDPKTFSLLINARSETVNEKPAFKSAMKRRRCLLPADGFYEWKREDARKQPYFIRRKDGAPMTFAGLWETWTGPNGGEIDTAAIITTLANRTLTALHDRMPVLLAETDFDLWLGDLTNLEQATGLLKPAPEDQLEMFPVTRAVNRVVNDDPRNLEPLIELEPDEPRPVRKRVAAKGGRDSGQDSGQGSLF